MRRSFKLSIAAVAIFAILCSGAAFAATEDGVRYLDANGEPKTQDGVTVISETTQSTLDTKKLDQARYVVRGHPKFTDPLWFTNASGVSIILEDGATLEVSYTAARGYPEDPDGPYRRTISADHSMTIYAQSTDRETMGCISADRMLIGRGSGGFTMNEALYVAGPLSIQGGMIKARATAPEGDIMALNADDITVEAHAVLEVDSSGSDIGADNIVCLNFMSSGDVTVTATATRSWSSNAAAIRAEGGDGARIVGGAFRATAVSASGSEYAAGVTTNSGLFVEGGWVETYPDNYQQYDDIDTPITHTGGALIVGDTGTVSGDTVIPAGMTATPRNGVTLTFKDDAKLTVEQGAKLDTSGGTLANASDKIANDGVLCLTDTIATKEDVKALNITGTGKIYRKGRLIRADGTRNYIDDIAPASKKFRDEASAWTPEAGDWEIAITPDDGVNVEAVSIDGEVMKKDADWAIWGAGSGELSAKASEQVVVISAETLSGLVDETTAKEHTMRITMTDDGYAELKFWVGTEKLPIEDDPPSEDDPPTRHSSSGACASGAAAVVALSCLAVIRRRKR